MERSHEVRIWLYRFLLTALLASSSLVAFAQAQEDLISKRLVGRPLYLREAWLDDKIDFDGQGRPIGDAHRGPLTLAGVDITKVRLSGSKLELRGQRVALIAPEPGGPLRRETAIASTTRIWPTLRSGDGHYFKAQESVQFTVLPDAQGSFEAALTRIFADGLADLAVTVPSYWKCYAASFFVRGEVRPDAKEEVEHCAETQSPHVLPPNQIAEDGFSPVRVAQSADSSYTRGAAQIGLRGSSTIYVAVMTNGVPTDFQVIEALGGGLDEETMQAASQFVYRPATENGKAAPAGFMVEIRYGAP
jgi:Gram-negative bacterial TonB protein C-terminal